MKRTVRFAVILGAMAAAATGADAFEIDWMTTQPPIILGSLYRR